MATLGYVRTSNGPDLAQVGANEQLVSHVFPNTTGETLRITHVSAWVGNWGGTATMRFGIWAASSSSAAPGTLLAQTVEFSPTVNYMDGGGGQLRTIALTTPYDLAPGQVVALGVASRNASAGIAMFQAQNINRPNENFYRKSISGTTLQTAAGSTVTNEGHLAIYITGNPPPPPDPEPDPNRPPLAPTLQSPSGTITGTVRPTLRFTHRDPDGDSSNRMQVQVETSSGASRWNYAWNASIANGGIAQINYNGSALLYYTTYRWRARTRDTSNEWGPWSSWVTFTPRHNNRRPNLPSGISGTGTIHGTRTTTVSMDFTDPDWPYLPNGQAYERFEQKQVRLRRVSDNVLVYNPGIQNTTASERGNRRSSTTITVPSYDVLYQFEERHRDRQGSWSPWRTSPTQILARAGGAMERPTSPAGFIDDPASPGNVSARYINSSPVNATTIQFRLTTGTGASVATRSYTGISVSPGTTFTRTWAQTFPDVVLGQGQTYSIMARAIVSGSWTTYSGSAGMTVNSRPDTPVLYQPPNGNAQSSLPLIGVRADDSDQRHADALTVTAEIYNADTDELVDTINLLQSTPGWNVYRERPSGLPYGNYKWRARSTDGVLTSAWSPLWTFTYAAVPAVSITNPSSGTITTSQPMIEWSSTDQTHWRLRGYDGERLVYDTGIQTGGAQSIVVAASANWIGGERWNNYETFDWHVSVRDSSTLWGDSDPITLTLEYIPPTPLTVESVEAMTLPGVDGTHYAVITTTQPEATEVEFIRTIVDRVEIDGPAGNVIDGTLIPGHFESGSSGDTSFADFDMTSHQWYRWSFRYEMQSGVDVIESEPVYAEMMVSWYGTLLHMPFAPLENYVWLKYGEVGGRYAAVRDHGMSVTSETDLNGAVHNYVAGMPTAMPSGAYTFLGNDYATAMNQLDTLYRMFVYQNPRFAPDGRPHGMCWREGRGGRAGRLYVMLTNWNDIGTVAGTQAVDLEFIPNVNGGAS